MTSPSGTLLPTNPPNSTPTITPANPPTIPSPTHTPHNTEPPINLEWFTPIHQDYPRAGERHVDIFPHRNSRFPTPHQCVSETHTVPPVPPHATAIAPTPQAVPVTAIRDPLQLAFPPDRHPSDSLHPHTLTEMTRAVTLTSKLLLPPRFISYSTVGPVFHPPLS